MKHHSLAYLVAFILLGPALTAQRWQPSQGLLDTIDRNIEIAVDQYRVLADNLPPDRFPKTYFPTTGAYEFSGSGWWCSGFYPATLLYLFDETGDSTLLAEARRIMQVLEKEKNNTTTHDLGFMMYDPFGHLYRMEPSDSTREVILTSAKSLATRFAPAVSAIKSWDSRRGDYLVIIDNMMNLELLYEATKLSGDSTYAKIADTHAHTTMKNHFRPDNSSYHVINYNPSTGAVNEKVTAQGLADSSVWARGQSWGLYGFTTAYRETGKEEYLQQARDIASFILSHPNLPDDKVPYWDYDAPAQPGVLRDASAGAIMASALLELSEYVEAEEADEYLRTAETILRTLSSDQYLARNGRNGGFLLKHSVGHVPQGTEIDVPLTYADYYFVQAMHRYRELTK